MLIHMTQSKPKVGTAGWIDLTVSDAPKLRDFYSAVVGWNPAEVPMKGYADYAMNDATSGEARAGVCHKRGANATMPAGWMVYFVVADLDASLARCREQGGKVLVERRADKCVVIEDPSGAICALYQG
jgi:predicted enzyme related to lactoylglutathione lyase